MSGKKQKRITASIKTLAVALVAVSCVSYFSVNYFYVYGHIGSFSDGVFGLLQWLKLSALVMIPAAAFLKSDKPVMTVKWFYIFAPLLSLGFIGKYMSFDPAPVNAQQEAYQSMNRFMPYGLTLALFILESVLMAAVSALFFARDGLRKKSGGENPERYRAKNLIMLIPVFFCVMPLSLFDNIVRLIPESSGFYKFLLFKNFTVWHFLTFGAVFVSAYLAYRFLKNKPSGSRYRYMRVFALALLVQYMSKASRLVGDGYNVYYTIIAFIPLFICNIGIPIAAVAIFSRDRILNNMSFFVHAAGALTVFFYFGKDEMSDYGTVLNYSFLYFAFTHAALFILCVLPVLLDEHRFKLKSSVIPIAYYAGVIVIAAVASELVTSITGKYYGDELAIRPNFAFTQVNPLPIAMPRAVVNIFSLPFDMLYLPLLFLAYVFIFFIVYGGYCLIIKLPQAVKQKKAAPPLSFSEEAAVTLDENRAGVISDPEVFVTPPAKRNKIRTLIRRIAPCTRLRSLGLQDIYRKEK
jgi:hypothetical protein